MPKATSNVSSGKAVQLVPRVETKRPVYKDELLQALQEVIDTGGLTSIGTGTGTSGLTQAQVQTLIAQAINAIAFPESPLAKATATSLTGKANPTQTELNTAVGRFLTAAALTPYATTASVTTALAPYATTASVATALTPYATTASVTTALAPYATTASMTNALKAYTTSTDLADLLKGYATTTALTTAVQNLPTGGLTEAQVQDLIDATPSKPPVGDTWFDYITATVSGAAGLDLASDEALMRSLKMRNVDWPTWVTPEELAAAVLGGGNVDAQALQTLTDAIAEASTLAQGVVNTLSGKPEGGGTLADVAAVFGNLGETFQQQIEAAIAGIEPGGLTPEQELAIVEALVTLQALIDNIAGESDASTDKVKEVIEDLKARLDTADSELTSNADAIKEIQDNFAQMGPALAAAIQSGMKALPDKITLNVKSANAADKVTIEAWQLTPHPPTEARAVDVDIQPYGDGVLKVKGKRVLTTDDALEAAGGGIDQAAIEAAIDIATADLRGEIGVLRNEIIDLKEQNKQLMVSLTQNANPTLADVAGLNLPEVIQYLFNNVPANDQVQQALDAKADKTELADVSQNANLFATAIAQQAAGAVADAVGEVDGKVNELVSIMGNGPEATMADVRQRWTGLEDWVADQEPKIAQAAVDIQGTMDILGGRKNATLVHVEQGYQSLIDYISQVEQQFNQTIAEVIEYVTTTYAEKGLVDQLVADLTALMEALGGTTPAEVAAVFQEFFNNVQTAIGEGIEEKIPTILEALSAHLENVLSIFTQGGQPGQVVTPAQLTQLTADIARDYATKQQLDTTIGAVQTLLDGKADSTKLAEYAKKDDSDQELVARVVTTRGVVFSTNDEILAPVDFEDYGTRLSIIPKNATSVDEAGIVVVHTDLADLVPGATREIAPAPAWVPVTYVNGASGTVETRIVNGTVFFRGQLVKTHVGDPLHVFTLPAGIPAPTSLVEVAVPGEETNVAYRIASLRVQPDGHVCLIAPQRVTHTNVSDLSYLTEP